MALARGSPSPLRKWIDFGRYVARSSTMSKPEKNRLVGGSLSYYIRQGKHSMTRQDWQVFLDFADRHVKKAPPRP